jgi:hypothetical protein
VRRGRACGRQSSASLGVDTRNVSGQVDALNGHMEYYWTDRQNGIGHVNKLNLVEQVDTRDVVAYEQVDISMALCV